MKRFALITATLMSILGFVGAETIIRPDCAPRGTHFRGSDAQCSCDANHNVICESFRLCGVGNTNARANLASTFSATVQCTNPGDQVVEAQAEGVNADAETGILEPKNGCLTVPGVRTDRPEATEFESEAECPNTRWTKMLLTATVVVDTSTKHYDDHGALEPYISGKIMELDHSKHHQTYVNGFNAALEALADASAKGEAKAVVAQAPLINFHGGGHVSHSLFWENLAPNSKGGGSKPEGKLLTAINGDFGSFDALQKQTNVALAGIQGSGWAWLVDDKTSGTLSVVTRANQDPPPATWSPSSASTPGSTPTTSSTRTARGLPHRSYSLHSHSVPPDRMLRYYRS